MEQGFQFNIKPSYVTRVLVQQVNNYTILITINGVSCDCEERLNQKKNEQKKTYYKDGDNTPVKAS